MNEAIDKLLQRPGIWRGREKIRQTGLTHIPTGFAELDDMLPGGGWPLGAMTEIMHDRQGIGELRLIVPALARLSRQGKWVALIAPPHIPYPPALEAWGIDLSHLLLIHPKTAHDSLWAVEQALRAGTCGAVVAWPRQMDDRSLHRLQLAAEAGKTWGILFRGADTAPQASPTAMRLRLSHREGQTLLQIVKCRGSLNRNHVLLDLALSPPTAAANDNPTAEIPAPAGRAKTSSPISRRIGRSRARTSNRRRGTQMDLPLTAPGSQSHTIAGPSDG